MDSEITDNKFGNSFPPAMVFAGYVIIAVGLVLMWESPSAGFGVAVFGGLISLTRSGMLVDFTNKKYKDYTSFFGIRQGNWNSLDAYPYISVLHRKVTTTAFSRANRPTTTGSKTYYDIFLLNSTHRKKLMIKRHMERDQAIIDAKELAGKLGLQLTDYNPAVSQKTRARRKKNLRI